MSDVTVNWMPLQPSISHCQLMVAFSPYWTNQIDTLTFFSINVRCECGNKLISTCCSDAKKKSCCPMLSVAWGYSLSSMDAGMHYSLRVTYTHKTINTKRRSRENRRNNRWLILRVAAGVNFHTFPILWVWWMRILCTLSCRGSVRLKISREMLPFRTLPPPVAACCWLSCFCLLVSEPDVVSGVRS